MFCNSTKEVAMLRSCLRVVVLTVCAFAALSAHAQAPFYKNKRLNLLINFGVGGPADIEGRLVAKHLPKHIDGAPGIIVQNKEGAGGVVGVNYLGELGPRDGTMAGYLTAAAWNYVIDPGSYHVDFRTFEFVAYQPANVIYYARPDTPPGLKDRADLLKATGIVAGGLAADSSKDLLIRLSLDMLGVPFKYVTGFRSSAPARLALQRGEINLFSESSPSYFGVVEPSLVKAGQAIALWYDPIYDGHTFAPFKQMEEQGVPSFPEFYRKAKGSLPSGRLWDVYRTNLAVDSAMLRTVVLPPGSPQAAVDALRKGMERLNGDKEFAEDALKAIQFVPHFVTAADLNTQVRRTLVVDPAIRTFVTDYIKNPPK
jgi:tripartite-type tricarboxylate transporter receptor subunit TctC